jgi:UDPglucose 6-dehydrogenase
VGGILKSNIGVIGGLGHIGLIQAACLAKLGYKTTAYDINAEKMERILQGKMPFQELGLPELVMDTVANGFLKFTTEIKDLEEADIVYICVGTPSLTSGEADLSQVFSAVKQLAQNRSSHCLAVIKSTVPVGTSRRITDYLKEHHLSEKVAIVSNPEFLREGSGVTDFWEPARIVVGSQAEEASEKIAGIYAPPGVPVIKTSWENSELIKYASNAFLATKISFINEISLLCEKVEADVRVISRGIGLDPRINPHFIEAGVGFSGPCLEKDLKSLIAQFQKVQRRAKILEAVFAVNEGQRQGLVRKLEEQLGNINGKKIAVLGMAFKAETDDVRESHSLPVVKYLLSLGARITVQDPWVKEPGQGRIAEAELPGVEWVNSPYEAAKGKDAILILTAWQEYRELDLKKLIADMSNPLIVDGRNIFEPRDMEVLKINYLGVGI